MIGLEKYRTKFSERGWRVFDAAVAEALRLQQNNVCVEHTVQALADEEHDLFNALLRDLELDPRATRKEIAKHLKKCSSFEGPGVRISPEVIDLLKRALARARLSGRQQIKPTDLFVALAQMESGLFVEMLAHASTDLEVLRTIYDLEAVLEIVHARTRRREVTFTVGDTVRIKTGPFASFTGEIKEISEDKRTLKVTVMLFGGPRSLELSFQDVEKLNIRRVA